MELAVLFGGVSASHQGDVAVSDAQHHIALNDTCVLASGDGPSQWFRPKLAGGLLPHARAFHAAGAQSSGSKACSRIWLRLQWQRSTGWLCWQAGFKGACLRLVRVFKRCSRDL